MAAYLLKQDKTKGSMKTKMIRNCIKPDNIINILRAVKYAFILHDYMRKNFAFLSGKRNLNLHFCYCSYIYLYICSLSNDLVLYSKFCFILL